MKTEIEKNLLNHIDFVNIPLNTVFQIKYERPSPFRILRRWEKDESGIIKGFYHNIVSLDGEFYKELDTTDKLSYLIFSDFNAEEMLRQVKEQQEMK